MKVIKKTLKKESLGKRTLNQRGNPAKRIPSDDADIGGDPEDMEYDGISDDVDLSRYGKKDSTLLRIKLSKPITEKEFIDQSAVNVTAECHDIVNDSIFAVGNSFYVIENAQYNRKGHPWEYGDPAMFIPNEQKGTITLCLIEYGSWYGGIHPLRFNSSSEMDLILDDIYTFFPFLEKYPLENDFTITFNVGSKFIDKCHDADNRNKFAWLWDEEIQKAKKVAKEQIDAMWDKRKKHEINKDAEEEEMWKKHDDEERAKKDALDAELSELDDDNEYMESNMKKLNITKKKFNESRYFQTKYGKLEYVSESGKLYKTSKGKVLKFVKEGVEQPPVAESHDDIENDPAYECPYCGGHNCEFVDADDYPEEGYFDGSTLGATFNCPDCNKDYLVTFSLSAVDKHSAKVRPLNKN